MTFNNLYILYIYTLTTIIKCPTLLWSTIVTPVHHLATGSTCGPRRRDRFHWRNTLDAATLQLGRTLECFDLIEQDPRLDYHLPKKLKTTAGLVLKQCYDIVDGILEKQKPCIFKFGFTHCAHYRFYNDLFGYARETDRWEQLVVIYASSESTSPAFVEGALIQRHKGALICS